MKGVIFREFVDFVEGALGPDVLENMIERADVPSGARYTAVGKYDWREMVSLVEALSEITGETGSNLQIAFGTHLLGQLSKQYSVFFDGCESSFDLLSRVEDQIHIEVKKLYPDAELPSVEAVKSADNEMRIVYTSCRPFGDLCVGMIYGTADYFGEELDIKTKPHQRGLTIWIERSQEKAA